MVYLLLGIVSSVLISVIVRLSQGRIRYNVSMLAVNYAVCLAVAWLYTGAAAPVGEGVAFPLALGAVNGAIYLGGFLLNQLSIRENGVVLSATFMKLGLLVPMVVAIGFFGERPGIAQLGGFALAVAAILLINLEKGQSAPPRKGVLVFLLLLGGMGDAMSKVFEELGRGEQGDLFLLLTFASALVLSVIVVLWRGEKPGLPELLFGVLVGVPNYFSSRFVLLALGELEAVLVYPTYSVGTMLVLLVVGAAAFGERLVSRQRVAMGAILAALVLLNL